MQDFDGAKDDWGYHIDLHTDVLYVERKSSNCKVPLKMHIFEPRRTLEATPMKCQKSGYGRVLHWCNALLSTSSGFVTAFRGMSAWMSAVSRRRGNNTAPLTLRHFPAQMQDAKTAIRFLRRNAAQYRRAKASEFCKEA